MRRRAAIVRGGTLAATALLAPRALAAEEDPDVGATEFLPPPVTFEQSAWAVLRETVASGVLRPGEVRVVEAMRDRADEHARAVESVLRGFGATPPPRARRKEDVPLPGFYKAATRPDHLEYAAAAERGALAAWYGALQQLRQPELLRLGAAAMAADAQHLVVLRGLLGREPLPLAFETGRPE